MKEKDYNEYCLLWSVYTFMCTNAVKDDAIEAFIISYGLNSNEALHVAMEEEVEVLDSHLYFANAVEANN